MYTRHVGAVTPMFDAAMAVVDTAVTDGWSQVAIASVHDLFAGEAALGSAPQK